MELNLAFPRLILPWAPGTKKFNSTIIIIDAECVQKDLAPHKCVWSKTTYPNLICLFYLKQPIKHHLWVESSPKATRYNFWEMFFSAQLLGSNWWPEQAPRSAGQKAPSASVFLGSCSRDALLLCPIRDRCWAVVASVCSLCVHRREQIPVLISAHLKQVCSKGLSLEYF